MQFGKLSTIDGIESDTFSLPPSRVLFKQKAQGCQIYLGGTTWNIPDWVGTTYPVKTPKRRYPETYGEQFGTIEFNATHYRIYPPKKMEEWAQSTPPGFKFCPKFPQIISHFRRFKNCEGPTDDFIQGLMALGDRRGPAFIQLPPHFAPRHAEAMWTFLSQWPRELKLSIEFRHPEWFTGPQAHWEKLSQLGIGSVISDTAGRRDAVHMAVTAPHVIVRFGGYEGHSTDQFRLRQWARWIEQTEAQAIAEFYLLVHEPDSLHTPKTCQNFAQELTEPLQIQTVVPNDLSKGQSTAHLTLF